MSASQTVDRARVRRPMALVLAAVLASGALVGARHSIAASCDELFKDPVGDAANTAPGGDEENVENLDIVSGGIAGETLTHFTTQIKVKNLSKDFPQNANASINWYFHWTYDGVDYFSRARLDALPGSDPVYSFGTYEPPRYVTVDATTGSFNTGPNGTVKVDVPLEVVGAPVPGTATLSKIHAVSSIGQGIPGASQLVSRVDRGPDGAEEYGIDYPLGRCQSDDGGNDPRSPGVRLRFSDTTPEKGSTVVAKTRLKMCAGHAGSKIQLQKKKDGVFKTFATRKLSKLCRARFDVEARFWKERFRARWPKQDEDHARGTSATVLVKTHR